MIDPARIAQWARSANALCTDIDHTMQADGSIGSLTDTLLSPSASAIDELTHGAVVHEALGVAKAKLLEAELALQAAIMRTPPRP